MTSNLSTNHVWIFQGNPDEFDIDGYLASGPEVLWSVNQKHLASKMQPGDTVYFWRAAGRNKAISGIIAKARILELPRIQDEDPAAVRLWTADKKPVPGLKVRLLLEQIADAKQVIKRNWLQDDPILQSLRILRMANETNYLIPESCVPRLTDLWNKTGRNWSRQEAIAALWVYSKTENQELSKLPGSLTATTAVRIGRPVTGFYNKIQNFISLDPRNARRGFENVSRVDEEVWNEFFDTSGGQLKTALIDEAFQRYWSALVITDESSGATRPGRSPQKRSTGQGFISDPKVRRAVELRAMELAIEHYTAGDYDVRDVSSAESFDLECRKPGLLLRVEVKGTQGRANTIRLTRNEIEHARSGTCRVDLYIVSQIEVLKTDEGPVATKGEIKVLEAWSPDDNDLQPEVFTYKVPGN